MAKQRIVVKVTMSNEKKTRKALKIAVGLSGVESASLTGSSKDQIIVIGEGIDYVQLVALLRKGVGYTELVSVGPAEAQLVVNTHPTYEDIKIELQKIVSATNNFADENLVMEGEFGRDYKGRLLQSGKLIDIVAHRLDHKYENGDFEFLTLVSMLYGFKHRNIVSIIGLCDEKDEKIIVYEHVLRGCLNQHLNDPALTWFQRLQICLGVAHALSYIHYDVIHCGIDSSKVFLDAYWEPKLFGFESSTKYPQSWKHRLHFSRYFGTRSMTPKDDVYSFGVLLFEVLSGRKPTICAGGVNEKLDEIIHPKLREQMETQSWTIFSKTAYNCLNQQVVERPTMDQIVRELEEAFELQWMHDNIEHSVAAAGDEGTSANRLKVIISF